MARSPLAPITEGVDPPTPTATDIDTLLGPPPLLKSEDRKAYQSLLDRVRNSVKPADVIEQVWVRDIVDLMWETLRLRRLKAQLMSSSAPKGLEKVLQQMMPYIERTELAKDWAYRIPAAVKKVDELLATAQIDPEAIMAHTLSVEIDSIERIDRMLVGTEVRRNAVLREIDRHRESVARRMCEVLPEIEDAEFKEVAVDEPV